ncbi:YidB family protein [Chelativorans sp. YIM 93263]|uniref:YidB family protein n=1 Tax=Chelativorans sp. YIM 93263 TaxID=2906648 RepID=UPI0023794264|nr:YidB family protein [Chelativorans sp. YIM 93263]
MGLMDSILGKAVPGGAISKPLMIALGTLVVGKMMHHGGNQGQAMAAQAAPAASGPAVSSGPAATSGPAGISGSQQDGGLLGGMDGLLQKLQDAGHGEAAQSWVGSGQNKPIDPQHLHHAIGKENVSHAAQQAGMSEQELLSQLSKALPGLVDKLTANGKVPNLQELATILGQHK